MRQRETALHFGQGLLMGGADVVPGVSGGTVALIVGIYERLVASIRSLATAPVALLRGDPARARRELAAADWRLLVPLGVGIGCAIVAGSIVIPPLRTRYPIEMRALFFGLVAGSLPIPWRRMGPVVRREVGLAAAAAVVAFVLVGAPPRDVGEPHLAAVAVAAMIAICAMILPGVSGAFLLEAMGMYDPTLNALRELDVGYVAVFLAGAAVGLGLFAKLLSWLLEQHHTTTMAALVGLMVGALRALWPWLDAERGLALPPAHWSSALVVLVAVAGSLLVMGLTRRGAATTREPV